MKWNQPNFWFSVAAIYFAVLLAIVWIYNPDFLVWKNMLLFIPLFLPILAFFYTKYSNDEDDSNNRWIISIFLLGVTAIVVLFQMVFEYINGK